MKKKQFKAESQKLLDLMINSIYTNKEIAIRELISNASDAIDKIYFKSLTDKSLKIKREDLAIRIAVSKENRTITISDNGCGMNESELETNLGTIAESGSSLFKEENKGKDLSIIGQFGVGFYSAFMIANKVTVTSRPYGSEDAYTWESTGRDGYTITKSKKYDFGTDITLTIKEKDDDTNYDEFLEEYRIREIIKKYSNYIKYPIQMMVTKHELKEGSKDEYEDKQELEVLNSMVPIWKKDKKDVKQEDYESFYTSTFYDYEKPFEVIPYKVEGLTSFTSLLFIPSHAPYDLYTKEYEKGLQLYSNGVLIMDHCESLLPDHYSFVKGIVDSDDLPLNISRETLQQNRQIDLIAKNIEKKITSTLTDMLKKDRERYEKFFENFGLALKMGIYASYGMAKDTLQDLILFYSSKARKMVTFKEYVEGMKKDQKEIYYACGETISKIDLMPQVEAMKDKDYEILYLTDATDEFVLQMMMSYDDKKFMSVASANLDVESEEEKKELEKIQEEKKDLLAGIKDVLKGDVTDVKFTTSLKEHPVCLTTSGNLSAGMEKVINQLPNASKVKANEVLVINAHHPIAEKLENLYQNDKDSFDKYAKVLYNEARLIEGLSLENPSEFSDLVCELLSK